MTTENEPRQPESPDTADAARSLEMQLDAAHARLRAVDGAIRLALPMLRRHSKDHDFHGELQEVLGILRRGLGE